MKTPEFDHIGNDQTEYIPQNYTPAHTDEEEVSLQLNQRMDRAEIATTPIIEIFASAMGTLHKAKLIANKLTPELFTKDQEAFLQEEKELLNALADLESHVDLVDVALEIQYPQTAKITGLRAFFAAFKEGTLKVLLKREESASTREGLLKKIEKVKVVMGELRNLGSKVKQEYENSEIEKVLKNDPEYKNLLLAQAFLSAPGDGFHIKTLDTSDRKFFDFLMQQNLVSGVSGPFGNEVKWWSHHALNLVSNLIENKKRLVIIPDVKKENEAS